MTYFEPADIVAVVPEVGVLLLALLVVLAELLFPRRDDSLQLIVVIGLLVVMVLTTMTFGRATGAFNGMIARDGVSMFLKLLIAGVALMAALISRDYLRHSAVRHGEYYGLLLLTTLGMMVLAAATDLVTMFLGIETMSIGLYVLAGSQSEKRRSGEAALKYFLLGAFSTGFLLYGMALVYGGTDGKTNLYDIGQTISHRLLTEGSLPIHLYMGVGLMMIGFLFKVAAVPFHFWSPDVYQGAPTPITAFMSAGPKAAAFIAFLRLFGGAFPDLSAVWGPALWIVAAATMTLANIVALSQRNIKRMLAYSSIAHAGYLLVALLAAAEPAVNTEATAGMMFYLTAYYLMNIGAFTVAILVHRANPETDYNIDEYMGLTDRHPWIALAMALFMISLAGIPPTAGFMGKLVVFSAGVKAGLVALVVIAVLNSVVSVYYYLRIVVYMYMRPGESRVNITLSPAMIIVLLFCVIGIVKFGLYPTYLLEWVKEGAASMINSTPQITAVIP